MNKPTIISVDDERIILDSLKIQIEQKFSDKFIFEYAESAEEALDVIDELAQQNVNPLLVISDFMMPGMKGDEFARELKNKMPQVNIVLLTGQITREKSNELLEKQVVTRVLQKPWKEKDLVELLQNLS